MDEQSATRLLQDMAEQAEREGAIDEATMYIKATREAGNGMDGNDSSAECGVPAASVVDRGAEGVVDARCGLAHVGETSPGEIMLSISEHGKSRITLSTGIFATFVHVDPQQARDLMAALVAALGAEHDG